MIKMNRIRDVHLASGIFFLALSLRLVFLLNLEHLDPVSLRVGIDVGDGYDGIALRILETGYGKGYLPSKPVGYPLFLAALYATLGHDVFRVRLIQCIFGSFCCVLMFFLARELFKRRLAALLAGCLCAVYFPFIRFDVRLGTESLFMLLYLLGFLSFFYFLKNGSKLVIAACGILTGLSILVRSEILYILPLIGLYLLLREWRQVHTKLLSFRVPGLFFLCVILTLFPIMIRNSWAVGKFSISHPGGLWIFWAANTELGYEEYVKGNPKFYDLVGGHDIFEERYERGGLPNSWFLKETLAYIRNHPKKYAWLKTVQLMEWFSFFPREIMNPLAILMNLLPVIGLLALVFDAIRGLSNSRILLFWVLFFSAFYLAISPEHRHRLSIIDPILVLYTGFGFFILMHKLYCFFSTRVVRGYKSI